MIQFYVLSILANLFVGLYLYLSDENQTENEGFSMDSDEGSSASEKSGKSGLKKFFFGPGSLTDDSLFLFVFGCLSVFISLVKIFSPVGGVILFGDFLPVLAGFACGASLLLEYFNKGEELSLPGILQTVFVDFRKILGLVCIVISLIHFIIPGVLFF